MSHEPDTRVFTRARDQDKRRILRRESAPAEAMLWARLRDRQVGGRKFRRQHSVGPYVLDFYCAGCRLAVELDGDSHDGEEPQAYDAARTEFLEALGLRVIRFLNRDVYQGMDAVVEAIYVLAEEAARPSPGGKLPPSPLRREGSELEIGTEGRLFALVLTSESCSEPSLRSGEGGLPPGEGPLKSF